MTSLLVDKPVPLAVEWPATGFRQASNGAALQVPTLTNLDAMFNMDPLAEMVGSFAANENGTDLIRTHNLMCVPPHYILILLGQVLMPREAYVHLGGGAIRMDGFKGDCEPLLAYLQAACALQTGALVPTVQ